MDAQRHRRGHAFLPPRRVLDRAPGAPPRPSLRRGDPAMSLALPGFSLGTGGRRGAALSGASPAGLPRPQQNRRPPAACING